MTEEYRIAQDIKYPTKTSSIMYKVYQEQCQHLNYNPLNTDLSTLSKGALIVTQNVQGLTLTNGNYKNWMNHWKQQCEGHAIYAICLQETHTGEEAKRKTLTKYWNKIWGKAWDTTKFAWWSQGKVSAQGVGILLNPHLTDTAYLDTAIPMTDRSISVTTEKFTIASLYAPNSHKERENFFKSLRDSTSSKKNMIIAGDFNCVLYPHSDRCTKGKPSQNKIESMELPKLIQKLDLTDTLPLLERTDKGSQVWKENQIRQHSYWAGTSSARLDRIYISTDLIQRIDYLRARPSPHSDHLGVYMLIGQEHKFMKKEPILKYPLQGVLKREHQARLEQAIPHYMEQNLHWDQRISKITKKMFKLQRERNKESKQQKLKWTKITGQASNYQELLQTIINNKSRTNYGDYIGRKQRDPRYIYQKNSLKAKRNNIPGLVQKYSINDFPMDPPNQMAQEWLTLLGKGHSTTTKQEKREYLEQKINWEHIPKVEATDNSRLMAEIQIEEVQQAIRSLHRGKAAGSDGLPNDFYKDFKLAVETPMTKLFNDIMKGQALPKSFAEAIILPLPKTGDPKDAFNYRPISLLNTAYKVFTKIIARRLQPILQKIIHQDQQGFIKGRQISNSIQLMLKMLENSYSRDDQGLEESPSIILIDFRKAYDTVDRDFLQVMLEKYHFSASFRRLIETLHRNTTASFKVNDQTSHAIPVRTGIRQGCPLAPLLFLLVIEGLGNVIRQSAKIRGIIIPGTEEEHKCTQFVDDFSIFLEETRYLKETKMELKCFGRHSGLELQPDKSVIIPLNKAIRATQAYEIPILQPGETTRYLGIEVGVRNLRAVNWELKIRKITRRLAIARTLSNTFQSKVLILNTIILPSILFLARHFLPNPTEIKKMEALYKNYLWYQTGEKPRWKINKEVTTSSIAVGGLGVRDIQEQIQLQATKSFQTWSLSNKDKYWFCQDQNDKSSATRISSIWITPYYHSKGALSQSSSVLELGQRSYETIMARNYIIAEELKTLKQKLLRDQNQILTFWANSHTGQIQIKHTEEYTRYTQLLDNFPKEARRHWEQFRWDNNSLFTDEETKVVKRNAYMYIRISKIGDLEWSRQRERTFKFKTPTNWDWKGSKQQQTALKKWIWMAFLNDPNIHRADYDIHGLEPLVPLQLQQYQWKETGKYILATPHQESQRTSESFIVLEQSNELKPARIVELGQDPKIQHYSQLLQSRPIYFETRKIKIPLLENPQSKKQLVTKLRDRTQLARRQLARLLFKNTKQVQTKRLDLLAEDPRSVAAILQRSTWRKIWSTDHILLPYQTFFWYRLTTGRLSFYNPESKDPRGKCHLCEGKSENTEHLLWDCVLAKKVWQQLHSKWTGINTSRSQLDSIKQNIFQREPPAVTVRYRYTVNESQGTSTADKVEAWNDAWVVLTTALASNLWSKRNDRVYNALDQPIQVQVSQIFNQAYHQMEAIAQHRIQRPDPDTSLWWVIKHIKDPPNTAILTNHLRLFYDGGSRGNPGQGGSGWIILEQRSKQWKPYKAGWHYHQAPCSNNTAEIKALLEGLSAAVQNHNTQQTQLTVVGDSQFVQKLLLAHYTSKKFHQQTKAVHQLLAQFLQIAILHTKRKWNTMADHLANKAMDMRTTEQLTAPQLQQIKYQELFRNDNQFVPTTQQSFLSLGSGSHS